MNNKLKAYAAGLGFSVIFGFTFLASSVALEYTSEIDLIALRFLIAYLFMFLLVKFNVIKVDYKGKDLKLIIFLSFMQPVIYFIAEVYGIANLSSSEAGMMIALIPVVATILSGIFLKEKITLKKLFFIFISFFGVIYINYMKRQSGVVISYFGLSCMIIAVLSAASYNILSKKASSEFKPLEITYQMMKIGAISFNVLAIGMHLFNSSFSDYFLQFTNPNLIVPLIYLGIIASVGGFFLVNYSLSKLPVSASAVFANVVTVVAIFAGVIFLNEEFHVYSLVGSIMIIIGVYGTITSQNKKI